MSNGDTEQPAGGETANQYTANDDTALSDLLKNPPQVGSPEFEQILKKSVDEFDRTRSSAGFLLNELIKLIVGFGDALAAEEKVVGRSLQPAIESLVKVVVALLEPIAGAFGGASKAYLSQLVKSLAGNEPEQGQWNDQAQSIGADMMFDSIVSPMAGITGAFSPSDPVNGPKNTQRALGGIVSLHLMTWVVNVISNLTGLGTLKFVNSFNEVALAAMNARGLTRVAMKPYLDSLMVEPTTNFLNLKNPLKNQGTSQIIKNFLRGGITEDEARRQLRLLGFDEALQDQFLLDAVKFLPNEEVARLVNLGRWTDEQGVQYLQAEGWSDKIAPTLLNLTRLSEVFSIQKSIADRLEGQLLEGKITEDDFKDMMRSLEFSDLEIEHLIIKAMVAPKPAKKFNEGQLKSLFNAGLIDLNRVHDGLIALGWPEDDAQLLMLLDFVEKEQHDATRAVLRARARLLENELKFRSEIATNRGKTDIAAAQEELAKREAALAKAIAG